ncbi:MAG: hypothetical protein ACR5LG_14990 [Sodalis sp. (in: enterobacteria)]
MPTDGIGTGLGGSPRACASAALSLPRCSYVLRPLAGHQAGSQQGNALWQTPAFVAAPFSRPSAALVSVPPPLPSSKQVRAGLDGCRRT